MVRKISTTFGSAMAALCLVSTLAMAQPQTTTQDSTREPKSPSSEIRSQDPSQSQHMTCSKDDGMGNCTAATGPDGKDIVVVGTGVKTGDTLTCVDMKGVMHCIPAS